jgi:DNA modification methylase
MVLDPYMGAGTTAVVCERLSRRWVGCELNPDYAAIAERRIKAAQPGLALGSVAQVESLTRSHP